MITCNGRAQWVVFTSRTSKVLKSVDGIFANLYTDLNNRPVCTASSLHSASFSNEIVTGRC